MAVLDNPFADTRHAGVKAGSRPRTHPAFTPACPSRHLAHPGTAGNHPKPPARPASSYCLQDRRAPMNPEGRTRRHVHRRAAGTSRWDPYSQQKKKTGGPRPRPRGVHGRARGTTAGLGAETLMGGVVYGNPACGARGGLAAAPKEGWVPSMIARREAGMLAW